MKTIIKVIVGVIKGVVLIVSGTILMVVFFFLGLLGLATDIVWGGYNAVRIAFPDLPLSHLIPVKEEPLGVTEMVFSWAEKGIDWLEEHLWPF